MKRSKLTFDDTQRVLLVGALSEAAGVWEQMAHAMLDAGQTRLARMMLAGAQEAREMAHTVLNASKVEVTLREAVEVN